MEYMRQKGNPDNLQSCHSLGPRVPRQSDSLNLSETACICITFRFWVIFSGKNREKYIYFIFPETEITDYFFK